MALLELEGVVAGYVEGIDILNGLSLGVTKGTLTGIIGPNGAGKSTSLKTVFGFLHPRAGRIVFDGHDVGRLAPHALKQLGMGRVRREGPRQAFADQLRELIRDALLGA